MKRLAYLNLMLFALLHFSSCFFGGAEAEMHLIPKGYEGPVIIVFNDSTGTPPKYKDGWRVYEIPADGVFRTQFKEQSTGYIPPAKLKYYYVDGEEKTEIPYLLRVDDPHRSDLIYVYSKQLSDGAVWYTVSKVSNGEEYRKVREQRLKDIFPPQVQ